MRHTPRTALRALAAASLCAAACDKPAVSPGLDVTCRPGNTSCQPGAIVGNAVYSGPRRGDVVLLLFSTAALPPPDGLGTTAVSVARIPKEQMFGDDLGTSSVGPFSASYTFTQVPPDSYQIRAFIDASGTFEPFYDFAAQPHAGDPLGGHVSFDSAGVPHLAAITVGSGQRLNGVSVALGAEAAFDPPAFTVTAGPLSFPQTIDRPQILHLSSVNPGLDVATFSKAKFGVELRLDQSGLPAISDGDGLFDVFPMVLLKQIDQVNEDGSRSTIAQLGIPPAFIPAKVNPLPTLPRLFANLGTRAPPLDVDGVDVLVEPFAVNLLPTPAGQKQNFVQLSQIPAGAYQLIVIEKSGQVWTMPNSLGLPKEQGGYYGLASQNQHIEVTVGQIPSGGVRGTVRYTGPIKPGNITLQAYKADPSNPPPPLGTQLPVRVKVIRASQVPYDGTGFSLPYVIDGLAAGKYIVEALDDADGRFSPFNLLQTPTKGDVLGGHFDALGHLAPVDVGQTFVDGVDVALAVMPGLDAQGKPSPQPLDPPAFVIDESRGAAQFAQDARGTVRLNLKAKPLSFPVGAGTDASTKFTVALVPGPDGKPVDLDHDGLPDVWPRVFLVQLDPSDPRGLTPASPAVILPAAVDPTPFMGTLLANLAGANQPVVTKQISVIVRPAALDASNPAALRRLPAMPAGRYKIVVMNQTGQVWQIPNESGTAALDPRAAAVSDTASQSRAFTVLPAANPVPSGAISGTLRIGSGSTPPPYASANIFAYDIRNPPPPAGTGAPVSVDVHTAAEANPDGTVSYALRGLPPGQYFVTAVVDTRGDFALDPQIFAAAPGAGTLTGGAVDSTGQNLRAVQVFSAEVPNTNLVAGLAPALPSRPSFSLAQGGQPVTSDVTTLFPDGLTPQRLTLHADSLQGAGLSWKPEQATGFPVMFRCDPNQQPILQENDNLPALYPRVLVVRLSDADPTGLTPDPNTTVIPASVDPTRFVSQLSSCSSQVQATDLPVLLQPTAVQFTSDGRAAALPIPPGRYGVVLVSATGQTWRLPNELQPSLRDPNTPAIPAFATQGVAISVAAQVPAAQPGSIRGTVRLTGYSASNVGNLVLAAYASNNLPPPLGLGRPLAVQVIPRSTVAAFAPGGSLPYAIANLAPGSYSVVAMMDRLNRFSGSLSFMATPGLGAQLAFAGGAYPQAISVGSGAASGYDVALDASATPSLPFDRPAFALDASTPAPVVSSSAQQPSQNNAGGPGSVAVVTLRAGTPSNLPYAVGAAGGSFHPVLARCGVSGRQPQDPTQTCTPGQPFQDAKQSCPTSGPLPTNPWVSSQVYVTPLDTGSRLVPAVQLNACQFCQALTGSSDCSASPLQVPQPQAAITVAVTNIAIDPAAGRVSTALPPGHYAITVVEPTGLVWSIPNELGALGGASATQGAVFTVAP